MKTAVHSFRSALILALAWAMLSGQPTVADVRLPGFFGDHMVLQQGVPVRIWGWAEPGESVEVTLGEHSASTTTGASGQWRVSLPALQAGPQPYRLKVQGGNTIELQDVLIGEVWLCSGQSNMEWSVQRSGNAEQEIADARHPLIRHIKFGRRPATTPQVDVRSQWQVCTPETVASFTATGYYTARKLQRELGIPIGLINASWGGTRIEPWIPLAGLEQVPGLDKLYRSTKTRTPGTPAHREALTNHLEAMESWLNDARTKLDSPGAIEPHPDFPADLRPLAGRQDPTALYNGMIHALAGFPIRGVLWYQGEANRNDGMAYYEKKKALIHGWRKVWQQGDFPFFFVQIAPFQYGKDDPEVLPAFWEAQAATLQIPNTAMVVTNDIATTNNIHPPNKQDVGGRLALLALKHVYGQSERVADSPTLESLTVQPGQLRLKFRDTGGGLKTRDGQPPSHFEISGPDSGGFQPAEARIEGDSVVVLKADSVAAPLAFRFAWHKLAEPNLTGGTGLPVAAVRGGEVPESADAVPNGGQ